MSECRIWPWRTMRTSSQNRDARMAFIHRLHERRRWQSNAPAQAGLSPFMHSIELLPVYSKTRCNRNQGICPAARHPLGATSSFCSLCSASTVLMPIPAIKNGRVEKIYQRKRQGCLCSKSGLFRCPEKRRAGQINIVFLARSGPLNVQNSRQGC